ncbi:MAG: hypothetical protein H6Q15_2297 [Bacteroidetes bacterium]|nr:hypothetical protein [Bacteroidota bacterium]
METTNTELSINRELSRQRAEDEAKRADMKQHADKLIQGFEKLEESHAKRAIWELFQNAIDLSENSEIVIELKDDCINFKHNGKPFTTNTLSCLIKQVSSKNTQNNEDEVGQYGTGFITTHSFGKKILISGSLKEDGYFIPIENFEIDRVAQIADPELIDKLLIQQKKVFDLVEKGELKHECNKFTTFSYQTNSDLEKLNAENAIDSLMLILPYVMMINKKIQNVKVYEKNGTETIYQKGEIINDEDLIVNQIYINQSVKKIYSLYSESENLIIILPLIEKDKAFVFEKNLSKLFLYYPLIGTEEFGFNYLVHSKQFSPTEPRDGIHLKSKNEQVQEKEKHNRYLIEKASELISDFSKKNCLTIQNPLYLADINFNSHSQNIHLSEYFKELKSSWVERFKAIRLVETENERLAPENTYFFSSELLLDEKYFDSIYSIVNLYWNNIPKKEITASWTEYVTKWEYLNLSFLKITDIVKKIEEAKTLDSFSDTSHLKQFYEYLIEYGYGEIFNQHKLLPNIKDEFRLQSQLNTTLNIDEILIKVADTIIPDVPKRYIKSGFEYNLVFEPYDRKQFSKEINSQISEYNKSLKEDCLLEQEILNALIDFCKIFPSMENTGTRGQLVNLICEYYNIDSTFENLPNITNQEIDFLTPIKCLLRNFIWELNSKDQSWIESNKEFLRKVVFVIYDYYEYDDIVQTLPIFPNQLFELCKRSELKLDGNIPYDLKDLYDDIVNPSKLIRSTLVLEGFGSSIKDGETKYSKSLGDSIEKVFQDEMPLIQINEHPHKKEILWIIKKIADDDKWAKYFPTIEEKKAIIMMARISDNETKNDLFSIIGLEKRKIALLGKLSRRDDLERLIALGEEAIEEEDRNNADFIFKHTIGTHIEKLIREKIGSDLTNFKIEVREQQGGQDIIVEYNNNIVYYIEVKSRWDIRNSITMSPLQMENSVINKSKYSLCCVDMTNYKVGEADRYNVSDINIILDRINVLNDIGDRIAPLLTGVLAVKDLDNEITLSGDYRGTIPQSIVKLGEPIDDFVNHLIPFIRNN